MSIDDHLHSLGIELPKAAAPAANYVPYVLNRGMLYIAGQITFDPLGGLTKGRLGDDMDVEAGYAAARLCGLNILAQILAALGSFNRVTQIVKLGVFVNSTPDFTSHPEVANGASDLMVQIFGDAGRHARSAVGVASLPRGVAVEVDAIVAFSGVV